MAEGKVRGIDPPLCKNCGHRHWLKDGHTWGKQAALKVAVAKAAAVPAAKPKKKAKARGKTRAD